ncbi:MAG: CHASE2 domain-containing protein, partial [Pseudomonadota bacterium]
MNPARLMFEWAALLALAIFGTLYAQSESWTGRLDNQILDTAASIARPPVSDEIVIVAIDDASMAEIGAWPWSRAIHGALVDELTEQGARLIVLDILFLDPMDEAGDAALAEAMTASGRVLLPHSFTARPNAVTGIDPLMPIPILQSAAAGVGHVVAEPDSDGVLRRFDLILETDLGRFPHVAMRALDALEISPPKDAQALIGFHSEADFTRISAAEVLAGATLPNALNNKLVLVGATAQGMGDRYSVATGSVDLMTGIGSQANLLNSLLSKALITPVSLFWQGAVAAIVLFALFIAFWNLHPRYVLVCAGALILALFVGSLAALGAARVWFPPAAPIAAVLLAYPLWSWRRLSHVSRYLDREARRLMAKDRLPQETSGLDYVTAQIEQLRSLIRTVRGSLRFLREVIEAAPDAILVLDRRGGVHMMNERAAELFPDWDTLDHPPLDRLLARSQARQNEDGTELTSHDGRTFLI